VALRKGVEARPEDVFVTVGGKGVMVYAIMALIDPGDEVIVPDPAYPIYDSITRFCGGTPVPIPLRAEDGFELDPDRVAAAVTPRTKLLVLNSPANPTGGVLGRAALERLAELTVEHGLVVLADEIYGRILYDGAEHVSIATLPGMAERTVILDGFSKTYAMTGWRLGYAVSPAWLSPHIGRLIINTISCAPTFVQVGAVQALRGPQDEVDAMVAEFTARRSLVIDGLNAIPGVSVAPPKGAFYAFPDVSGTGLTGAEMYERLLLEAGVCTLPGTAFGAAADRHIRISYATSRPNLEEALRRIAGLVAGL
jgi:aspartate aminotransferase